MASKAPFKVHSLTKHIQDANKSRMSSSSQPSRLRAEFGNSKPPNTVVFDNDSDNTSSDSDGSSEDDGTDLLAKLFKGKRASSPLSKQRPVRTEIADSDEDRIAEKAANAVGKGKTDGSHPKDAASSKPGVPKAAASSDILKFKAEPKSESTSSEDSSEDESSSEAASSAGENQKPAKGDEKRASPDGRKGQAAAPAVKTKSNEDATTSSSSTSGSGSESEEEDDDDGDKNDKNKGSQAISNAGEKQKLKHATDDSSDESDESSDDSDGEDEAAGEQSTTRDTLAPTVPIDKDSIESEVEAADESIHMEDRSRPQHISLTSLNNSSFELHKSDDGANGRDIARICSEANMQGKHFWYFTVPSNVPVSLVQNMEIPMGEDNGQSLFSHDGQDHGIAFNSPRSSYQILIPAADGSDYHPASQRVGNTVQIRRIINLNSQNLAIAQPENSTPQSQPEDLQSRLGPMNSQSPHVLSSKVNPPNSKKDSAPAEAAAVSVAKNENHVSRKGKRKLTASSEQDAAAAANQLQTESQTAQQSKTKKRRTDRKLSPDLGTEPSNAAQAKATLVPPPMPGSSLDVKKASVLPPASTQKRKPGRPRKDQTAVPSKAAAPSKKTTPVAMTPVPIPRQTAVPPPVIPSFAQSLLRSSPVSASTPVAKSSSQATKTGKKLKAGGSAHQSPPPSAQAPAHKVVKNVLDSQRPSKSAA
ncbi:hypothetical protein CDD81_2851 [Ophiocordyceps australis]|uniref:RNA polymerase I, subunit RPA34.5 n=1 Tax=Ophiocordyceps australis TaxID=1399860 RepID=A0A2C5XVX7_9HYPO|nr:hypothetical protein CDD81_2851 [Ophiocordyceps australis]